MMDERWVFYDKTTPKIVAEGVVRVDIGEPRIRFILCTGSPLLLQSPRRGLLRRFLGKPVWNRAGRPGKRAAAAGGWGEKS